MTDQPVDRELTGPNSLRDSGDDAPRGGLVVDVTAEMDVGAHHGVDWEIVCPECGGPYDKGEGCA